MKKIVYLMAICAVSVFGVSSGYAGLIDMFAAEGEGATYADEQAPYVPQYVQGTIVQEQKSYYLPYHIKETKSAVPHVAPPPVLWGKEELYYPYQIEPHAQRKLMESGMAQGAQTLIPGASRPVVVCRKAGCTRLNDQITRQFLFNSLLNIFLVNKGTRVDLCEADPNSRACLSQALRFGGKVGAAPALIQIDSFTLADVRYLKSSARLDVYLLYNMYVNGVKAQCNGAFTSVEAVSAEQILMRDRQYNCSLTSGVPTSAFSLYNIDYIDLDYGLIGAYYSIGLSGESAAGGNGYVMMKFFRDGQIQPLSSDAHMYDKTYDDYSIPPGEYEVKPVK